MTRQIEREAPDIVCLTEARLRTLTDGWHVTQGGRDPGYQTEADQRKVMLASRHPWVSVDAVGHEDLPPGRFVAATTQSPIGPVTFVAICIPWSHAHVATGRRNRKAWEEHLRYLTALKGYLDTTQFETPVVLLGDFNQRVPRRRNPVAAYESLLTLTGDRFSFLTGGHIEAENAQAIDHVCIERSLSGEIVKTLPRQTSDGLKLSDHFGLVLTLRQGMPERRTGKTGAPGET